MRVSILLLGLLLAACAPTVVQNSTLDSPRREYWQLTEIAGVPALRDRMPTLTLENGRVFGSTGCNGFLGTYERSEDGRIAFADLEQTVVGCLGRYDIHNQENRYMRSLPEVERIAIEGDRLTLMRRDGETLQFVRR